MTTSQPNPNRDAHETDETKVMPATAAGSTAVPADETEAAAGGNGGGWWKWLLGILVALLLVWLLLGLFNGGSDDEGDTAVTETSTVATETSQETVTVGGAEGAAEEGEPAEAPAATEDADLTEQVGDAAATATEQAGEALEDATDAVGDAASDAAEAVTGEN